MSRRIVLARDLGELWLALLEESRVVELLIRPESTGRWLGTIAKGKVTRVAPGIRAVFTDLGLGRDVFTIRPEAAAPPGRPLKPGDEIVVQIIREADAGKGFRATPTVTIPGWSLVLAPGGIHRGVSQRIVDEAERQRLREILEAITPAGTGVIARTAAAGASAQDLEEELAQLLEQWAKISSRAREHRAPAVLHREDDPTLAFLRDNLAGGLEEIIVEGPAEFLEGALNDHSPKVKVHPGPLPAVEAWRLDRALEEVLSAAVGLPSGGRLVIQSTEALVAIDVNSGRDVSAADLEQTALRTNLEAAREVVRQVRLRDLGGLIVVDFIDMTEAEHRAQVGRTLAEAFAADRAKSRVLPLSEFCCAEITRQRQRRPLERFLLGPCPCCGRGQTLRPEAEARRLLRELRRVARPLPESRIRVRAPLAVQEAAREILAESRGAWGLPDPARVSFGEGPGVVVVLED